MVRLALSRVDEDLGDTDDHHEAGDDTDKLGRKRLVNAREQAAGDIDDEICAHRVVEGGLTEVAAGVGDTLAELALLADATVRGCRFVAHFFFSLRFRS